MNRFARIVLAPLCALALASAAFAAADDNKILYPSSAAPASAPSGGGLGNVTLIVGLLLAGVGGWLVLRGRRAQPRHADGTALEIEETRSLGNRQYLVVAAYEDKKFLLGVCQGRIDLLAPLHDEKPRA